MSKTFGLVGRQKRKGKLKRPTGRDKRMDLLIFVMRNIDIRYYFRGLKMTFSPAFGEIKEE
jgi:hypothetical protein